MTYVTREARQGLLDTIAEAVEELAAGLAALGAAYEALDDATADRVEDELFRPVQTAYGRARQTYAAFAERHRLDARTFAPATPRPPSLGIRGQLDAAVAAVDEADLILSELQDSMLPVEVGDPEVRSGLADVRETIGVVRGRAREVVRVLGR